MKLVAYIRQMYPTLILSNVFKDVKTTELSVLLFAIETPDVSLNIKIIQLMLFRLFKAEPHLDPILIVTR